MRRFFVAVIIGSAIAAAASTSASAWHCLASSPNGAAGTAFGVILERAQSISMRRCIHRGGGLVAQSHGAGCTKGRTARRTRRTQPTRITRKLRGSLNVRLAPKATEFAASPRIVEGQQETLPVACSTLNYVQTAVLKASFPRYSFPRSLA